MQLGLIADGVIAVFAIVMIAVCTKRGFARSLMRYASSIIALVVAFAAATPLAEFFDQKFNWVNAIERWHVPIVTSEVLLKVMVGVGVFVAARLLLMLLDKALRILREKLKVVNAIDRVLGSVLGLVMTIVNLIWIFWLIDKLGLTEFLQLTKDGGSLYAHWLFSVAKKYLFPVVGVVFSAFSEVLPETEAHWWLA